MWIFQLLIMIQPRYILGVTQSSYCVVTDPLLAGGTLSLASGGNMVTAPLSAVSFVVKSCRFQLTTAVNASRISWYIYPLTRQLDAEMRPLIYPERPTICQASGALVFAVPHPSAGLGYCMQTRPEARQQFTIMSEYLGLISIFWIILCNYDTQSYLEHMDR